MLKSSLKLRNNCKIFCINKAFFANEAKTAPTTVQHAVEDVSSSSSAAKPAAQTVSQPSVTIPKIPELPKSVDEIAASFQQLDKKSVCSFDEIPGPQSLRLISKFWSYVPLLSTEITGGTLFQVMNLGKFFGNLLSWGGNANFFQKFFNVYGPVVRLHGPFGGDVVLLSRPEHASLVFKNEEVTPIRACLDSVEHYRINHRRLRQAGPFLMSGTEWETIYESLEKPAKTSTTLHFKLINSICDDFTNRIFSIRNLQDEMPKTFKNEILKWCLECTCAVSLKRRMGFLDSTGLSSTSDPGRILDGVNGATESIVKCEHGFHIWKFMETPAFKSLLKNCDTIDSILSKYVERTQTALKGKKDLINLSLIETLLIKDDVLIEDVMTVMLDMILIGANATAHSVAFLLYNLCKSPRSQRKLYEEIMRQPKEMTTETLKNMRYLQACMKESLRLSPPIPILNRVLGKNVTIHKYQIPKGTYVLIAVHLASLKEEYFEDAMKFIPERWLSQEVSPLAKELQEFAAMPFGHGPKSCQANKELAEVEIALLVVKLLKKFTVEFNYGEIHSSNSMLATPTKLLKFRFIDRA